MTHQAWRELALGDCVGLVSGGTPSKSRAEYWGGELPWVSCKDMKLDRLHDAQDHLTSLGASNGTRVVPKDTILFVVRGMILAKVFPVALTRREMAFNQDLKAVRCADFVDTEFLFYWLKASEYQILGRADEAGHGTKRIQTDRLLALPIRVPPLPIQRRIASILSAYDDLIENCQRRIRILEDMARSLYREWFVHFRFPGADALPRVDSPLGPIPKGWLVCALSDIAVVHRGRSYRSVDLADEGGLPFVNLKCLNRDGGFRRSGLKRYTGDFKAENVVRKGDIVIAVTDMTQERRIVARAAWVPSLDREHGVLSMDMVGVEPLTGIPKAFLYAFLRFSSFANEVKQHANGANVLHLSPDRIRDYQLALPLRTLIGRFAGTFEPILALADALENRIEVLRRTRDLLLPRLLSGQIDVGVAEKSVPA